MEGRVKVKLVNYTKKPLETVTWAALVSYWREWESEAFERTTERDVEMHLPKVLGYGHESILEHAVLTFSIEGCSRVCTSARPPQDSELHPAEPEVHKAEPKRRRGNLRNSRER